MADIPPVVGSGRTPEYDRLVDAHRAYREVLEQQVLASADPRGDTGRWVPYALFHHLLELARCLEVLVAIGYSEEAMPTGRAMLSAAVNLIFIVKSDDPDGWALRYWLQVGEQEVRMIDRAPRLKELDPIVLAKLRASAIEQQEAVVEAHERGGGTFPEKLIGPGQKKPRTDTWTGLSDREVFKRLGLESWYETEYDFLSTVTHVQAVSLLPLRDDLLDGQRPSLGPHFRSPIAALNASVNAMKFAALHFMKHFSVEAVLPQVDAAGRMVRGATDEYLVQVGANDVVATVFGVELTDTEE
jgi:hypothetical protein